MLPSINIRTLVASLAASVLLLPSAKGQHPAIRFDHITTRDGLSQDIVTTIVQDSRGFMWFGTEDGLNRYDGYSIRVYNSNRSDTTTLAWNSINALLVDREGRLWVSANGVNLYNERKDNFRRFQNSPGDATSLPSDFVASLCQDSTGTIWAGTSKGLARLDMQSGRWERFVNDPKNPSSINSDQVLSLLADRAGNLWVGTQDGLNRFDAFTGTFKHYLSTGHPSTGRSSNAIVSIFEGQNGLLWLATNGGGLIRFDPRSGVARRYRSRGNDPKTPGHDVQFTVKAGPRGRLWIGHFAGLDIFDPESGTFEHYRQEPSNPDAIGGERIYAIYPDNTGAMWLGSYHGGVERFDPHRHKFGLYRSIPAGPHGVGEENIFSFLQDSQGRIWIGTQSGLAVVRIVAGLRGPELRAMPVIPHTGAGAIVALLEDRHRTIWIGHDKPGELERANERGEIIARYPIKGVQTMAEDDNGDLWLGTLSEGIIRLSGSGTVRAWYRNKPDSPDSLWADGSRCIFADGKGSVWIGSNTGVECVDRFDLASRRFVHYRYNPADTNSLPGSDARAIYQDRSGAVWFGFWGAGLTKYESSANRFTRYYDKQGMPSNYVKGILEDDRGQLWISTEKGLSRFDPKSEVFRNFTQEDGLQGDRFWSGTALRARDGTMLFGGNHGLNVFHPDSVREDKAPPVVRLTNFKVFDKPLDLGDAVWNVREVELSYRQDFLSFEYVALDYSSPERNRYAYKLEGFDHDWTQAGSRRYAAYTHLDGGTYRFRVRAANSDGVWNETGASIQIVIDPPYWETLWFRLLVAVTVAALLYLLYRVRLSRVLAVERLRQRIAQDLHDDIGTNLSTIALASRSLGGKRKKGNEAADVLERIGSIAQRTTDQMKDIVWVLKTNNDSLDDILVRMRDVAGQLFGGMRYTFQAPTGVIPVKVDLEFKRNIFLFYKECLNNVVKHARATAVTIRVDFTGSLLTLVVEDNGRGFAEADIVAGSGLQNLRIRGERMNGTVSITSKPGEGTSVRLTTRMTHMRHGFWRKGSVA